MIISHRYRFIYFANARTGTTSIEKAFKQYHDDTDWSNRLRELCNTDRAVVCPNLKHIRPATLHRVVPEAQWCEYFKFVFVRNPWDWVISQFLRHRPQSLVARGRKKFGLVEFYGHWWRMRRYRGFRDEPSYRQYHFITDMDYVGRFESLEDDLSHACRRIGITPVRLMHINGAGSRQHYRNYYNTLGRELVAHHYREDIGRLGYSF